MSEELINEDLPESKEFIYGGFRTAPIAMFLTLQTLAIIALFIWCANISSKATIQAERQAQGGRKDADKQVERIIQLLRPDLQQIKDNVQQAKENMDTVSNNIKQRRRP